MIGTARVNQGVDHLVDPQTMNDFSDNQHACIRRDARIALDWANSLVERETEFAAGFGSFISWSFHLKYDQRWMVIIFTESVKMLEEVPKAVNY